MIIYLISLSSYKFHIMNLNNKSKRHVSSEGVDLVQLNNQGPFNHDMQQLTGGKTGIDYDYMETDSIFKPCHIL